MKGESYTNASAREQILADVDRAIDPDKMGPEEALDWLEEFQGSIEARISGIKSDLDRAAETSHAADDDDE